MPYGWVIVHSNVGPPPILIEHRYSSTLLATQYTYRHYNTEVRLVLFGCANKSQGNTEPVKWHHCPWEHFEELFLLHWLRLAEDYSCQRHCETVVVSESAPAFVGKRVMFTGGTHLNVHDGIAWNARECAWLPCWYRLQDIVGRISLGEPDEINRNQGHVSYCTYLG